MLINKNSSRLFLHTYIKKSQPSLEKCTRKLHIFIGESFLNELYIVNISEKLCRNDL